ncbi:MAG: DNRLRE domain-containing protein, partial [Clostridia bacterium]|nr:DNRLRE domain-containing protein [Clostridia bacterium]
MKSIVEFPAANDFNSDSVSSDNCFDATLRAVAPTQAATESFYMVEGSDDTDDSDIRTGLQSDGKERVSLIRFSQLPELSPRDTVTKAVMKLYPGSATRVEEVYVGAYAPQHDWTAAEMTWSIMSCLMSDAELHSVIMSGVNSPVLFDITNLVRRWYKDPSSNRGILLRRPDLENDSSRYPASFYPQDDDTRYPRLEITYVSHTGTESRWTYQSLNAGRAGAVSADLFNGSLVAAHADTAFGGLRGGVSVAHTYNSCECSGNNFFCGYGWRTSLHQTVHTETMGTNTYYVWTDGDGTEHYFKVSGSQPYADEDGQHLKLRVQEAAGTVTITDLKDSVMTFTKETGWEKYWLTQTKDVLDNAVNITYLSEGKINRGTDPVGRYVQFVYSNDLLSSLVPHMADDSTGAYVSCAYTYTNGNLTGVSYSDLPNEQTGYTYTGHLLTGMANYDGLAVSVAYESNENSDPETRRVTSLKQTGGTGASSLDGAKMLFTYKEMSTHVTFLAGDTANDETDHELIYQFNDNGNVVSVRDDAGYAAYKGYDAEYPNYPDVASRLQRTSVNLLTNHSFETSTGTTYWTTALSNGATGSFTYATNIKKMGGKSLKTSHTNASGEMTVSQAVTVKTGETYTFSGYVRTENDGVQVKPVILRGGVVAAEGAGVSSAGVWTRVHVTAEINPDGQTSDTITVQFRITGAAGAAYIDCAQLEYGDVPNRYNMLTNGCFEYADANDQPTGWTAKDGNTANDAVIELTPPEPGQEDPHRLHPDYIGRHVLRVNGYPNKKKGYYQAVVVG